jgi:hypothetical protein
MAECVGENYEVRSGKIRKKEIRADCDYMGGTICQIVPPISSAWNLYSGEDRPIPPPFFSDRLWRIYDPLEDERWMMDRLESLLRVLSGANRKCSS